MNWTTLSFPAGGVECAPGDFLIRQEQDGTHRVYLVEDILAVQRLVPEKTSPRSLRREEDLLDSMAPAYLGEPQLLLSLFQPGFADAGDARRAIRDGPFTPEVQGLLRAASHFPATHCELVPRC